MCTIPATRFDLLIKGIACLRARRGKQCTYRAATVRDRAIFDFGFLPRLRHFTHLPGVRPPPIADFGHIVPVLGDIQLVFDQRVAQPLLLVSRHGRQLWNAVEMFSSPRGSVSKGLSRR